MTPFQQIALLLIVIWLVLVVVRFRRSNVVLVAGLFAIGLFTLFALVLDKITLDALGLGIPNSWLPTLGFALAGLVVVLAYSPIADRLASRWFEQPPTLKTFRVIQQSRLKLIAGIVVAWVLGGILEELVFRGIVLNSIRSVLSLRMIDPLAAGIAICIAALGAGLIHLYQGPRATLIITQLSVLFGVLFVISGYNLWAVMLCHGLYDTVAFVRFANKQSKYSNLEGEKTL